MINELKNGLNFYLAHFSWIDFATYIWLIFTFLTLLIFCVYIMIKHHIIGFLLLLLNLGGFCFGIFYIWGFLDANLRQRSLELISTKELIYSKTLLVDLNLTNFSKKPFKYCEIGLKFYTPSNNFLKNELNKFKPILKENIILKGVLDVNETRAINAVIDGFRLTNYDIIADSECF